MLHVTCDKCNTCDSAGRKMQLKVQQSGLQGTAMCLFWWLHRLFL